MVADRAGYLGFFLVRIINYLAVLR